LRTFAGTGYDILKELAGEMVDLLASAASLLHLVYGLSSLSMMSPSVPNIILAFFFGGAAGVAAAAAIALAFNTLHFRFLTSGIVFDGSMLAIYI
jgi:hypothetical protein